MNMYLKLNMDLWHTHVLLWNGHTNSVFANTVRIAFLIVTSQKSYILSKMSPPKVPHIVGDEDEALKSGQESDGNSNDTILNSGPEEDESSNEDGADWSMNVIYLAGTPKRACSPLKITEVTDAPAPNPAQSTSLSIPKRRFASPGDSLASESIGERVSRRLRHVRIIETGNASPQTSSDDPDSGPAAQLAKPLDVTSFFHRVSASLVEQRVCIKPFLALRKRITRMVTQSLNESKRMRK
ncbi:uncharacterized protein LOC108034353 [Drosophila biarmipes]|uniref:uncharacterized protein LOC108034353 n=1 Tax=Drosophila biarmipes TaxID=125945 RepID=UPI0021CD0461|nr:uncharacterized protein LOC108034353 [Drosophila biarmipes]